MSDHATNGGGANNTSIVTVDNYIGGKFVAPSSGEYLNVVNPSTMQTIGRVGVSNSVDVDEAVAMAKAAFPAWSRLTIKARAAIVSTSTQQHFLKVLRSFLTLLTESCLFPSLQMMKFHNLVREHAHELAELIVKENGKNITEALADGKGTTTMGLLFYHIMYVDVSPHIIIIAIIIQSPRAMKLSNTPAPYPSLRRGNRSKCRVP
jgi:hypothetical protein